MQETLLKYVAVVMVATLISGCALTSGYAKGPHGKPVFYIDGMNAGAAYRKADQKCPDGYDIIGGPTQTSPLDYEMTVECK